MENEQARTQIPPNSAKAYNLARAAFLKTWMYECAAHAHNLAEECKKFDPNDKDAIIQFNHNLDTMLYEAQNFIVRLQMGRVAIPNEIMETANRIVTQDVEQSKPSSTLVGAGGQIVS